MHQKQPPANIAVSKLAICSFLLIYYTSLIFI